MPVGLEETFHGVKVAPDITYTNTFQFPERNYKVTAVQGPPNRPLYLHINSKIRFAKPNLDAIARPDTRHAYDEVKLSLDTLVDRGLVKSMKKEQRGVSHQAGEYLRRVPTTTPLSCKKPHNKSSKLVAQGLPRNNHRADLLRSNHRADPLSKPTVNNFFYSRNATLV